MIYHKFLAWFILVPIVSLIGLMVLIIKDRTYRFKLSYLYSVSIILLSILVSIVFIKIKFTIKITLIVEIRFILIPVYIVPTYNVHLFKK